ncbi:V-type ATPase subunit [bacterium]|nr:V-type ATPase subunit [bacterium]
MTAVGTYANLNAKIRAMKSQLFSRQELEKLSASPDLPAFISFLEKSGYEFPQKDNSKLHPEDIEKYIIKNRIDRIKSVKRASKGEVGKLVSLFLERDDILKLESILRQWNAGITPINPVVPFEIIYKFPVNDISKAKTIEEIAGLIKSTPFANVLMNSVEDFNKIGNLFPVEIALEKDFYYRLFQESSNLSKSDMQIIDKIVGTEVDLKNVLWIKRLKNYYEIPVNQAVNYLLPGGSSLKIEEIRNAFLEGREDEFLSGRRIVPEKTAAKEEQQGIFMLEVALREILIQQAEKAFKQFPFSIGSLAGYIILLKIEEREVVRALYSVAYKLHETSEN